jgi:hypothetical protein
MVAAHVIKARVSSATKARVGEEARRELLTESVWLRRLVIVALDSSGKPRDARAVLPAAEERAGGPGAAGRTRLSVGLRHDDRAILRERAAARGMPAAAYVSVLVRSHLRALAPLPRDELAALKRSIAELGSTGRNLNQLARAALQSGRVAGPGQEDLRSMLKICEAMREHVKSVVRANVASWEAGHGEADR